MRHLDPGDDRGSVLILGLAGIVLVVTVVLVAGDIAALSSARRGAQLSADAAARAAVQAVDLDRYYRGEIGGSRLPLDPTAARVRAARVVASPWRLVDVRVDEDVVRVAVTSDVPLQVAAWLGHPHAAVTAVGSASLREFD